MAHDVCVDTQSILRRATKQLQSKLNLSRRRQRARNCPLHFGALRCLLDGARGCLDHQGDSVRVGDVDQMAGLDLAHLGS